MNKKIIVLFAVLLFAAGMVWAENDTADTIEIEDNADYISPVSISNGEIKFTDGFAGFAIDSDKNDIGTSDNFLLGQFSGSEVENTLKLIIIECYRQGKENEIGAIISEFEKGGRDNEIINEALNSNEKIGSQSVVNIDNTTEATFNFELLKSADEEKSDCIAYTVTMKTVENPDILEAAGDDGEELENSSDENTDNQTDNPSEDQTNPQDQNNQTDNDTKQNEKQDSKKTDENEKSGENRTEENEKKVVSEKNETVVNKTTTVTVNENNTTVINSNNVKTVNTTSSETPQNNTVSDLLKAGNPILILVIVIAVILVAVVVMRRKD